MITSTSHGTPDWTPVFEKFDSDACSTTGEKTSIGSLVKAFFKTDDDWSGLIMRVMLGLVFFPHGAQKVLGWFGGYGFSGTMGFLTQGMGIPYFIALLVIAGEFLGSLGLITGFLTRLCGFGITSIMTGAIIMVHYKNGFFMNWMGAVADGKAGGEGFEYHLLAIGLALALLIKGGGKWSFDRFLVKKFWKE